MPSHAKEVFKFGNNKVYMQIRESVLYESRTYRHYRFKIKKCEHPNYEDEMDDETENESLINVKYVLI